MINLVNYLVEANLILLVAGLVYFVWLKGEQQFQMRRIFILAAVFFALTIPSLHFTAALPGSGFIALNKLTVITLPELVVGGERMLDTSEGQVERHWFQIISWFYAIVCLLLLIRFGIQLFSIRKVLSDSTLKISNKGNYRLIESDGKYPTFSFFNYMIINLSEELHAKEKSQIIAHELVHIRQYHSLDVVLLEMLFILFWYNPVSWFFRKAQAENHEYIADAETLSQHDKIAYQNLLVKMTVDQMQMVGNYFSKIETLKRINMMNEKPRKANKLKVSVALVSLVLVMSVLACSEGLVQVNETQGVVDFPPSIVKKMNELKVDNPGVEFSYYEVEPNEGGYNHEFHLTVDSRDVKYIENFKERNRLGIIHLSVSKHLVYDKVDDNPVPRGGMESFYNYIGSNMKYPTKARQGGIEGQVFVQFVIDKSGKITDLKVLKGIGGGCDEEAMRVLATAQSWIPGKLKEQIVQVRMVLPISFKLGNEDKKKDTSSVDAKKER